MNKTLRISFVLVCAVVIAILGLFFIRNLIDFPVYYAAGRSLIQGRTDLYSPDFAVSPVMDYRYPPFFLLALVPLWLIPYPVAAYIWYLLSILEIAGCVLIVGKIFPVLRQQKAMWLPVAFAVGQYFVMVLHYGNAHLLAVFLLFGSLYLVLQRKDLWAALLMALTITIKLTPILLLPYFALKRRWSFLLGVCAFLIAINLAPSAYFGLRRNADLLATWYRHVVSSQEFHEDNGPINLSLKGQLRRYLTDVDYSQRVDGDVDYAAVNLASVSRQRAVEVWVLFAGVLFAGVLMLMWRARQSFGGSRASLELALMICVILMVGPLTSKIYFIALLWPVACLVSLPTDRITHAGKVAFSVLAFISIVNFVLPLLPGRSVQRLLLVLGVDFYLNCLLMVTLIYSLVWLGRGLPAPSDALQTPARSKARTP
ncbi:MAG TPA: glycosyltransferase family 87 protein [Blastocatellia bacterium]|nr:glycosyltransferase family 87 protein [Blastocatellia bacterium]